jgi:glycosyltransferase involved in cell wall biosynthesis
MTKPVAIFCVTTPMSIPLFGNRFHLLIDAGIDLHIVVGETVTESIPELPTEVTLHVVPMTRSIDPLGDITALAKMVKLQRRLRPRLVAAATPKASLIGLLAARLNRIPVRVWEVWGAKWDRDDSRRGALLRRIDRLVAQSATDIIAVSPSLAELLERKGVTASTPRVLGAGSSKGVDLEHFQPLASSRVCNSPTLGFVGRISRDKGAEDVLRVAQLMRRRIPNLRLLLVGAIDSTDPPDSLTLEVILNEDWITVTGWVPDTASYFREMDVLVFPSRREGLPNVLLEASASAVPVVAYRATGTTDVIVDEDTGLLAPLGDVRQMATAVRRILESPHLRRSLAEEALRRMKMNFASTTVSDLWRNYYLKLLQTRSHQT